MKKKHKKQFVFESLSNLKAPNQNFQLLNPKIFIARKNEEVPQTTTNPNDCDHDSPHQFFFDPIEKFPDFPSARLEIISS